MPWTVHAGAESKANKRSHLQMNVATAIAIAPLGQPGYATLATHEGHSVADFLLLNHTVLRLAQSTNFSGNTSHAKLNADKRSCSPSDEC